MTSYQFKCTGESGTGHRTFGILHKSSDGLLFVGPHPVSRMLDGYVGRFMEFHVWFPNEGEVTTPMDPKIKPLVEALNQTGVQTVESCQGHWNDLSNGRLPYPYITFISGTPVLNDGWFVEDEGWGVSRLRLPEAGSEAELEIAQAKIDELVQKIRS